MTIAAKGAVPPLARGSREAIGMAGRLGYAARGLIYFLVGASAAVAAWRPERRPVGMTDAVMGLQWHRWGWIALLALAGGLVCLAIWFAAAGLWRRDCTGFKRWVLGIGMLGDAAVYATFTLILLGLMLGWWHSSGERGAHAWTAWLLHRAYGRWLTGALGAALVAGGLGMGIWAFFGHVERRLDLPPDGKRWARILGRAGYAGRGLAIALVGAYLIGAAIHANPREAHELGGMLTALRHTAYGEAAMLFFAVVFIGSSAFDFVAAIYRRFDPANP